jgi:hypothetical protein
MAKPISEIKQSTGKLKDACWSGYTAVGMKEKNGKKVPNCVPVKEAKDEDEYDQEGDMAKTQLRSIMHDAKELHDMLEDNDNLPEWVQSKITLAQDYISTVHDYMGSVQEGTEQQGRFSSGAPKRLIKAPVLVPSQHMDTHKKPYKTAPGEATKITQPVSRLSVVKSIAKQRMGEAVEEPPFKGPYKKKEEPVTDKSGAKHSQLSRVKHLAKSAMKKQMKEQYSKDNRNVDLQHVNEAKEKNHKSGFVAIAVNHPMSPEGQKGNRYTVFFKADRSSPRGRTKAKDISHHQDVESAEKAKQDYASKYSKFGVTALKRYNESVETEPNKMKDKNIKLTGKKDKFIKDPTLTPLILRQA